MPRRVEEDHKHFRDVVDGKIRKSLQKHLTTGRIFKNRGKKGKLAITIPTIGIPHIVFGDSGEGLGRGPGKKGDIVRKGDKKGQGGTQAGEGEGEGITVNIDMEYVLQFIQDELELPNPRFKPNDTVEETYLRYNSLSLQGPNSLRHPRKTFQETMKRLASMGELEKLHKVPGVAHPIPLIIPIDRDFRYRQYTEIKKPSTNAVIFFARDGSASMDQYKCDIVSDMAWWIDVWIRHFYKRVERCYIWHDWTAQEVDEDRFYKYRYGGGTTCSSAMSLISKQFENRFPPNKWNIYVFYFTDGENWGGDNEIFSEIIQKQMSPRDVNFVGITQIMSYSYENSLKKFMDDKIKGGIFDNDYLRTASVGGNQKIGDDEKYISIKQAIKDLMGKSQKTIAATPEGV